mmetsp:Transcript_2672/g.6030  ORF Transcript_2672/g.6030 Transcript_2672/m.6030 type:complete len:278 (+) Transcript_2672:623-1456(+)
MPALAADARVGINAAERGTHGEKAPSAPIFSPHGGSLADDKIVDERVEQIARLAVLRFLERVVAEPADRVQPIALKDVAPVQHTVVVAEQYVARLHWHSDDVALAHLVDMREHVARDDGEVAKIHVGHADLGHAARPTVPQEARVVVHVAEPNWPLGDRMAVDRRLRVLNGLQPHLLAICAPDHVEIHVELGRDFSVDDLAHFAHGLLLELLWQWAQHVEVEIAHRDAHLALDQRLDDFGVEVAEDRLAVSDEELASRNGGRLEADKGARLRGLLEC